MKISILVPACNEETVIHNTLHHLCYEVIFHDKEIIVCDDGSTDNTYNIAKKYPVKVLRNKTRKGVTFTMNKLIKAATGEICIKFDADMKFCDPSDDLKMLHSYMVSDDNIGGVYYSGEQDFKSHWVLYPELQKERNKSWASRGENVAAILVHIFRKKFFPIRGYPPKIPIDIHCFKRNLIDHMDESIIHDDVELANQVLKKGYRIEWCDSVIVFTPGGQPNTTKDLWNQKTKGNLGWRQMPYNYFKYLMQIFWTFLKSTPKMNILDVLAMVYWMCIFIPNIFVTRFLKPDNVKHWKRFKRVIK